MHFVHGIMHCEQLLAKLEFKEITPIGEGSRRSRDGGIVKNRQGQSLSQKS